MAPSAAAKRRKLSTGKGEPVPACVIPDWRDPRVSFECWADIFSYASRMGASDDVATGWLVHAATTCRAFAEPALTALYSAPVIRHSAKAKRLAALLARPISDTFVNYRSKIETLQVDIHIVPASALWQLIHPLARLKELIIYTPLDQAPYRQLDRNLRWHYSPDIFSALGPGDSVPDGTNPKPFPAVLKSWEWSGRLIGGHVTLESMTAIHQSPSFAQLTKLSLTNFQVPSLTNLQRSGGEEAELQAYIQDGRVIDAVAKAISQLTSLNHLVIESSTVMNDRLLPLLPSNLIHLELINCWEIKSADLATFLTTHGNGLGTLTLLHNQSLDLAFLTNLSQTCPNLRELHMNLSYYRHHDTVNDSDPMYDEALGSGQIPKWPSSLRVIDIEHIRDWSVEAAEMFFQSLIDSAVNLPNLRHLGIKTMLDIPWQARATMRQEWRRKLEKVFLRPTTLLPPPTDTKYPHEMKQRVSAVPHPRSDRNAAHNHDNDHLSSVPSKVTSLRNCAARPVYRDPDTDVDEDEDDVTAFESGNENPISAQEEDKDELPVQGMCHTVNILVDNQKVGEKQYGMEDFLDEDEEESEDEWNGDVDDDDDDFVVF
ncbi:hypothetical protein RJ55_07100 [Drechmeria coniospora]|nr:hypothetical protein RJ55_07100 [Drechmeria coniospora]